MGSADSNERYLSCTAGAQASELCTTYRESWTWSRELSETVVRPLRIELPTATIAQVERLLEVAGIRCQSAQTERGHGSAAIPPLKN